MMATRIRNSATARTGGFLLLLLLISGPQIWSKQEGATAASSPEMARLFKAFGGRWSTTEGMERGDMFPHGGSRSGQVVFRLTDGGNVLVEEGSSDGPAGKLHIFIIFWWDQSAATYRLLTCFDGPNPCKIRGTGHWQGDTFVNDYEAEQARGIRQKARDSFQDITENSFTLVAGPLRSDGKVQAIITTRYVRKR
jgi:hypothetical protein